VQLTSSAVDWYAARAAGVVAYLLLTGVVVATIAIDSYTPFSLTELVVPFASGYRPLWAALGIVAAELLLAVAVTNALRSRISHGMWRRAHYLTFGVWGLSTLHGIGAGSDGGSTWLLALVLGGVLAVAAALAFRFTTPRPEPVTRGPRRASAGSS